MIALRCALDQEPISHLCLPEVKRTGKRRKDTSRSSTGICKFKSVSPNCERYCDDECNGSESCFDKCTARDCSPLVNCSPCKKGDHSRFGDKEALWFFGDSNGEGDFRNATTLDFTNGEISMSGVYLAKTKNSEFVV